MNANKNDYSIHQFSFNFDSIGENRFNKDTNFICNKSSLENLAASLSDYMKKGTQSNSIIGITGNFGSGKTFFCEFLENYLNSDSTLEIVTNKGTSNDKHNEEYIFVYYNLWSHQNDPIKDSILRQITHSLLIKKALVNDVSLNNKLNSTKSQEIDIEKWLTENGVGLLKNNSKKTFSPIKNKAFYFATFVALIALLNQTVSIFKNFDVINKWMDLFKSFCDIDMSFKLLFVFFSLLIIFAFFYFFISFICGSDIEFGYSKSGNTSVEDTNNKDLSAIDFQKWLDVLISCLDKEKHVVVVLDNIDRLPRKFVENFFSSIHEIFSKYEYSENVKKNNFFVIIPFDYLHLNQELSNDQSFFKDIYIINKSLSEDLNKKVTKQSEKNANNQTNVIDDKENSKDQIIRKNLQTKSPDYADYVLASSKTDDLLSKTFSVIYYLPHISPDSFKDYFVSHCNEVIGCWQSSTYSKKITKQKSCLYDYYEYSIYCWEIFLSECGTENFTPRRINTFIKQLAVLFQLNCHNFEVEPDIPSNKIPQFFAVYAANVSLFRTNCFLFAINYVADRYNENKYGIFSNEWSDESLKIREFFYTSLEMLYYQTTSDLLFGDKFLFTKTLIEGFENRNIFIIKSRLFREYFYENTSSTLAELCKSFAKIDEIIDVFYQLYDEDFFNDRNKTSEQIWFEIYSSILKRLYEFLSNGNVLDCHHYELLDKILFNKLCNREEAFYLTADYYNDVICKMADLKTPLYFITNSFTFFVKEFIKIASSCDSIYKKYSNNHLENYGRGNYYIELEKINDNEFNCQIVFYSCDKIYFFLNSFLEELADNPPDFSNIFFNNYIKESQPDDFRILLDFSNSLYYSDYLVKNVRLKVAEKLNIINIYLDHVFDVIESWKNSLDEDVLYYKILGLLFKYLILRYISKVEESYPFELIQSRFLFDISEKSLSDNVKSNVFWEKLTPFCKTILVYFYSHQKVTEILKKLSAQDSSCTNKFLLQNHYSSEEIKFNKSKSVISCFSKALIELMNCEHLENNSELSDGIIDTSFFINLFFCNQFHSLRAF